MPRSSSSLPAAQTKGHSAANPGLRGHSCGEFYPLLIVGIGGHPHTVWQVKHAIEGWCLGGDLPRRKLAERGIDGAFKSLREAERCARIVLDTASGNGWAP